MVRRRDNVLEPSFTAGSTLCTEALMSSAARRPFEKEDYEMEDLLAKLEAHADGQMRNAEEIRRMRRKLTNLKRRVYSNLNALQTVMVSRVKERPQTLDYIDLS